MKDKYQGEIICKRIPVRAEKIHIYAAASRYSEIHSPIPPSLKRLLGCFDHSFGHILGDQRDVSDA
jgi:hypothetical protein